MHTYLHAYMHTYMLFAASWALGCEFKAPYSLKFCPSCLSFESVAFGPDARLIFSWHHAHSALAMDCWLSCLESLLRWYRQSENGSIPDRWQVTVFGLPRKQKVGVKKIGFEKVKSGEECRQVWAWSLGVKLWGGGGGPETLEKQGRKIRGKNSPSKFTEKFAGTKMSQKSREGGVREWGVAQIWSQIARQICAKLPVFHFVPQRKGAQNLSQICREFESQFRTILCKYPFSQCPLLQISEWVESQWRRIAENRFRIAIRIASNQCLKRPCTRIAGFWIARFSFQNRQFSATKVRSKHSSEHRAFV